MTYLTQVSLDFATAAKLHFHDNYDWHQAVWKAFPGRESKNRDFLTRLDQQRDGFRLLIVSPDEPVRPNWCPSEAESWKTKCIPKFYFTRNYYAFQLRANPTKKITKELPDGSVTKNGRRVPIRTREELVLWIKRKGEQGAFTIDEDSLRTISRGREYFERNGIRGLHSAIDYQGVLTVSDSAKFYETFMRGIGSAKAFGFGLLVITPLQ